MFAASIGGSRDETRLGRWVFVFYECSLNERSNIGRTKSSEPPNAHVGKLAALHEPSHRAWRDAQLLGHLLARPESPLPDVTFLCVPDHAAHSPAEGAGGEETPPNSSDQPTLGVVTGAWGDPRADLPPGHPQYAGAWLAWRDQDTWTDAEHARRWQLLLQHWPGRRGPHTDRDERAYIAWFLHNGHGVPLEELADQFGYAHDTLYRMARDGAEYSPEPGHEPTRVPRVFAIGCREPAARPRPPYRVTVAHVPHRFNWDHPRRMAFRWTDEHGCQQTVLPLDNSPWQQVGPNTFRARLSRMGTVYLPDGTPLEIDREYLERITLAPGGAPVEFVTGQRPASSPAVA